MLITIGRNVKRPRIARLGATNIQAMRGTPNRRWSARIGASSTFIAAAATFAGTASNDCLVKLTIGAARTCFLLAGGLDLFVDVGADPFQRIVERHFADDGLT